MSLETTLKQFGLNDKQLAVYLATLQLGSASVQAIAKKADVKRPTAYLLLNELAAQGLVASIPKKGKQTYSAENPEKLLNILDQKKQAVREVIPQLLSIYNTPSHQPQVLMYEGMEGIRQVYRMIAQEATQADWLADLGYINTHWPEIPKMFLNLIRQKKFKQREINLLNPAGLALVRKHHSDRFVVRYTTLPITIDFALFNDKVAIFSLKDNIYAVVIHDAKIVESFRTLYQLAWKTATPLNKIKS